MTYAIVYASKTGNTRLLAETIRESLPQDSCLWCGGPDERALAADRIYLGFWTDKGSCSQELTDFLAGTAGKEVFLFGTAGFGARRNILSRSWPGWPAACPTPPGWWAGLCARAGCPRPCGTGMPPWRKAPAVP